MAEKTKRGKRLFKTSNIGHTMVGLLTSMEDSLKTNYDNTFQYCWDKLLRMPQLLLDHLDFMAELKELGLHHCMVTVAVQTGRVGELDPKELYRLVLGQAFLGHIFNYLVSQKSCFPILNLSRCLRDPQVKVKWILTLAEIDIDALFQLILEDVQSKRLLNFWVISALTVGHIQSFELLLNSVNSRVQRSVSDISLVRVHGSVLAQFVDLTCDWRHQITFTPSRSLSGNDFKNIDFNQCVYLICKVGLFACCALSQETVTTPLQVAVSYNQPDIVRLLYQAGACVSNAEIFRLSRDPKLNERCKAERGKEQPSAPSANKFPAADDVDAAMEIRDFLSSMASRPRSLQDLCLQEVAKRLGWGQERDRRVEQLDIAQVLKERLTFKNKMLLNTEES